MSSSLAAQLSQIAAKSTKQLDLKAQRIAHSKSLIFDKKVAGSQDYDTIYQICFEGFQELCLLDQRFVDFGRSIFSEQSKAEDRTQMNAAQNKELDTVLESFLALVGGKLLLNPAVKAVDWLVRRFRVHEYNTSFILLTFLPYHSTPLFLNLLSILPEDLTPTFKVLHPYQRSLVNPPRHPLVHSATTNINFSNTLNNYVLQVCRLQAHHHGLLSFWAGIMTEAVAGMLDAARSGRIDVERTKQEDILLRILPVLNDGLSMKKISELVIGCYMIAVIIANKASLEEKVIDSLMEAVALSWTQDTRVSGLTCLSVLAQKKQDIKLPGKIVRLIIRQEDIFDIFSELSRQYPMDKLILCLVAGSLKDLAKQKDTSKIQFISNVIERGVTSADGTTQVIVLLLQRVESQQRSDILPAHIVKELSALVQRLDQAEGTKNLLQKAIQGSAIDITQLEMGLQTVIETNSTPLAIEDVEMADDAKIGVEDAFMKAVEAIPNDSREESFLANCNSRTLELLSQAFALSLNSSEAKEKFLNLPILRKEKATKDPLFLSFFARISVGSYPIPARAAALNTMASVLSEATGSNFDPQPLLPFVLIALADPSGKVRREAASVLAAMDQLSSKGKHDDEKPDSSKIWGQNNIYGAGEKSKSLQCLSGKDLHRIVHRALLPALEEYVLDSGHIGTTLAKTLRGVSASEPASPSSSAAELKKGLRTSLFTYLCSHVVQTPLYVVKLKLLDILNRVDRVGSTSRTQELLPVLQRWKALDDKDVSEICEQEQVSLPDLECEILAVVTPKDKAAVDILLSYVTSKPKPSRTQFVNAVFGRLRDIWSSLKEETQLTAAERLFEISLGLSSGNESLEGECRDLLRSVTLSDSVLLTFVDKIPASMIDMETQAPAPKRRRTSQNNMVAMSLRDPKEVNLVIEKMTFILELVDGSHPENHPRLLDGLFQTLAALHHFKSQVHSQMNYLLSLLLGSLLAIVNKTRMSPKEKLDTSGVRADLIVDCVRTTESPQVQNTALLLVSGLASVAPELVLHSVMPIFTFMGSSVLRKDDEYSVTVIDQTIDQVVPPLIQSLRNQKRDVVSGTSELLLSFTAAFEHIPVHRRLRLFDALITKLGPEDFLFAVLAMLANRYGTNKDVYALMTGLTENFTAGLQLDTYVKYMDLVKDALQPKPGLARVLLGLGGEDGRDPAKVAVDLLQALAHLLRHASLESKMSSTFQGTDQEESERIRSLFSHLLEENLALAESVREAKPVAQASGDVLGSLLGTLSLVYFLDTIEVLLQRPDDDLRRKVLRLLESRLRRDPERDGASQNRVLDFLSVLVQIIESSHDPLLKHAAVACIDRISDKYGKKNPSKVVAAAKTVSSERCIGQPDDRIRVMGVLCLASMAEVLGQAIIPILPEALSRSFSLLQGSVIPDEENPRLHDAVFSFISALFVHVPFMISDVHLDSIVKLSFESAASDLPEQSNEGRRAALRLLAKQVDVKESFGAIERNWSHAVSEGPEAAKEALEVVSIAIEKHPKSSTINNANILLSLVYQVFDVRRLQLSSPTDNSYEEDEVEEVEKTVNELAIKMIYKLNDTTFRPMFVKLVEWAANGLPKKDTVGRTMRVTSFFKFLEHFFGTLKSIVTSYSSYIIENAAEVLRKARPTNKESKDLWLATVRMLRNSFEHDQDEFWQSPSHFTTIAGPLVSLLGQATNQSTLNLVTADAIPAIVELAVSADSPDHHKEMNTAIMKFMRAGNTTMGGSGDNPITRLAALKCEQALTERLGEEWLALLPEMLPFISELMEDEDETVEREVRRWVLAIEDVLGEKLDDMLM